MFLGSRPKSRRCWNLFETPIASRAEERQRIQPSPKKGRVTPKGLIGSRCCDVNRESVPEHFGARFTFQVDST